MKKNHLATLALCIGMMPVVYHVVASMRWLAVHPRANEFTTLTHICDVWAWRTLPKYQ